MTAFGQHSLVPLFYAYGASVQGGPLEGGGGGVPEQQFCKKTACSSYVQPWFWYVHALPCTALHCPAPLCTAHWTWTATVFAGPLGAR